MPGSAPENKPVLRGLLWGLLRDGSRVLDCGTGHGDVGKLIREVADARGFDQVRLIGVEIWKPNIERIPPGIYDDLVHGDLHRHLGELPGETFDIVLLCDVVEHFERDQGEEVLREAQRVAEHVIVSVPIVDYPQGPWEGNPHEEHRAQWKPPELVALDFCAVYLGEVVGVFVTSAKG